MSRDRNNTHSLRYVADHAFVGTLIVLPAGRTVKEPGELVHLFVTPEIQTRAIHDQERTAESGFRTAGTGCWNYALLVGPVGIEPTTRGLKVRCSTD